MDGPYEIQSGVPVTAIPGVIAAGAKWKLIWQGPDNADGIVGTKDGGLLLAQEQPSTVGMLDRKDKFSTFVKETHLHWPPEIAHGGRRR